jgi:hypothetical protein
MLEVYDTLCFALLGMAFSSFCFTNVLAMLILRGRFLKARSLAPSQSSVNVRLKIVLGIFVAFWALCFIAGAQGVVKALLNEDFIPVLFLIFSPILSGLFTLTLFGKSLRAREREIEELSEEVKALREKKAVSDNWSDEWRIGELEAMRPKLATDPGHVSGWLQSWPARRKQSFRRKAFRAFVILGEPSYCEVLEMFRKNNMEDIKRWSLVTGRPIPK